MGLLDDAIREHLELKRKHGADPDEVTRQEQEALGPATRRGEFAHPGEAGGGDEPVGDEPVDDEPVGDQAPTDVHELGPRDEVAAYAAGSAGSADELPESEPGVPEEPATDREAAAPGYDEDPWLEVDQDETGVSHAGPPEEAGSEDVLEETPEFLQETPEHDRLWFEQKPPRDFDWDK